MSLLLNPKLPIESRKKYEVLYSQSPKLKDHVWLTSSGTTNRIRLIGLSQAAFEASAVTVNQALNVTAEDRWGLALPTYHVAGIGVEVRARLSGAKLLRYSGKWNPEKFAAFAEEGPITLTSLVPKQLRDLVVLKCHAPKSLRAVLIGGDRLETELRQQALELHWPIRLSYAMSETASTIAIDEKILPHIEAKSIDGRLAFKGPSLLTGLINEKNGFHDPKNNGWYLSDDQGEVCGDSIRCLGRTKEAMIHYTSNFGS